MRGVVRVYPSDFAESAEGYGHCHQDEPKPLHPEIQLVRPDGRGQIALGGVAHKPWRVEAAEAELPRGAKAAAAPLLAGARTTEANAFKLSLVERTLAAVLAEARG
jgi:hypothetical protein